MKRRLKINGVIMFCAFVLVVLFPRIFFRKEKISCLAPCFEHFAEIFGMTLILSGQLFRVSARGFKSEHSKDGHSLIQSGPYSLVRNPMYLGILLIGTGVVLMLFEWWVMCVFLLVFAARYISLIFKEEKMLLKTFPEDYASYLKRVPRILPSPVKLAKTDIRKILPLKLSWVKKEIGSILAVLFLVLFVESWWDIKEKGQAIYCKELTVYLSVIIVFVYLVIYLSRQDGALKDVSGKSKTDL